MPLSPPLSSNGELLQHGLQHLVQHNLSTSYPQEPYDEGGHIHSHYGSPTPTEEDGSYSYHGYQRQRHQPQHRSQHSQHSQHSQSSQYSQHQDQGLGIQYEGYSPDYQSSVYQDRYSTPVGSPQSHQMDTMRTRSGLGIPRGHQQALRPMPEGRSPSDKSSPKPKKVKKEKIKAEKKVAKLNQPLSVLTKDWKHVPVVDIDAYVNRSAEVRRKEVEDGKIPGKVKRPMNSFMLYRKAYQNRTKDWCLQNNHQVVSQVCGDSWPLEPDEIKDQFSEWARIERINHQNAHPGYKFSPTKPGTTKASKRKMSEELLSEESDLDDFDWRGGTSKRSKRRRTPRTMEQSPTPVSYPTTQSAYQYNSRENSMEPSQSVYNRSSYQTNNPGRPLPSQYQTHLQNGEYYQQSVQNYQPIPGAQDVILKKTSTPGVAHSYLGLPGAAGQDFDLMQQPYPPQYDVPHSQHPIDPSLMGPDQHHFDNGQFADYSQDGFHVPGGHQNQEPNWHQPIYDLPSQRQNPIMPFLEAEHNPEQIHDPHMNVLGEHRDGWHVESLETGGEFDKWMDEGGHHA